MVDLVDVCTSLHQYFNVFVVSPDQCHFQRKHAYFAHRVYVGSKIKQVVCGIPVDFVVKMQEWCLALSVSQVVIRAFFDQSFDCFAQGVLTAIHSSFDADENRVESLVVDLVYWQLALVNQVIEQDSDGLLHDEMHCILKSIYANIFLLNLFAINGFEAWDEVLLCIELLEPFVHFFSFVLLLICPLAILLLLMFAHFLLVGLLSQHFLA